MYSFVFNTLCICSSISKRFYTLELSFLNTFYKCYSVSKRFYVSKLLLNAMIASRISGSILKINQIPHSFHSF